MLKKYDVSVIIPVYNRVDELERTLHSLENQTLEKDRFEVVIADDGSSQDVKGTTKKFADLNIEYCFQEDKGFRVAADRNLGISNARGEILVFNDNGIMIMPDSLERHIALHNGGNGNRIVLGYMYGTDARKPQDEIQGILDGYPLEEAIDILDGKGLGDGRDNYVERFGTDLNKWYIPWLALWGGHFSVSSDFIEQKGIAFDENFTSWGGEDNEFGIQLCQNGAEYLFTKDIRVVHYPTKKDPDKAFGTKHFDDEYRKTMDYIAGKHQTHDVILWRKFGSLVNAMSAAERKAEIENLNI